MGSEGFRPLAVRAWLRTPVVSDPYLPLDGILFFLKNWERYGFQTATVPGQYSREIDTVLPLDVVHEGEGCWYYRCSWAQWGPWAEGGDAWNKRFDVSLAGMLDDVTKINTSQGRYRLYHVPIFYRASLWVEWFCVGNREEIERLLLVATHIGKKTSQGWGRVIRWEVYPIPDDWSIWKEGRLMRGIPPRDLPGGTIVNLAIYGIRPSYWLPENQLLLAMP